MEILRGLKDEGFFFEKFMPVFSPVKNNPSSDE